MERLVIWRGVGNADFGQHERLVVYEPPDDFGMSRPPIVALHGMWATDARWLNFAEFFRSERFTFVTPTLRLHKKGNERLLELGATSVSDYVADTERLMSWMSQNVSFMPPILIGHSMGGLIAQKAAEGRIWLSGLVLINSAPPKGVCLHRSRSYALDTMRYAPHLLLHLPFKPSFKIVCRYIMNKVKAEERSALYARMVCESGRAALEILRGSISVLAPKISCPILIIGCKEDKIVSDAVARDLFEKYRMSSEVDLKIYEGFGHWPQHEDGWERVAGDINSWIRARIFKKFAII